VREIISIKKEAVRSRNREDRYVQGNKKKKKKDEEWGKSTGGGHAREGR
jgi:hypothetical protein